MAFKPILFWLLLSVVPHRNGALNVTCPKGSITIAGAETVLRQVAVWNDAFQEQYCPEADITLQGGGYSMGAARVCDNHPLFGAVDVAAMPDTFFQPQAISVDGWNFNCQRSSRKAIMLHVGHSGIRVDAAAGGSAAACIELLGGLTIDQLRWMLSSLSVHELEGFGWKASSTPLSDRDDSTHFWSELHENCTADEILPVSDVDPDSITRTWISNHLLTGEYESMRDFHGANDIEGMDEYLAEHPNAIAILPFYNILSPEYAPRVNATYPVAIMDSKGEYIMPSTQSFETHDYPLLRRVDLGIYNDPDNLAKVRPFLDFALSPQGDDAIKEAGFWPIRIWEKITMKSRTGLPGGEDVDEIRTWCGPSSQTVIVAGSQTVKDIAHVWSQVYNLACPVSITLQTGGSTTGATRLCERDIDISMMTRDWNEDESTEHANEFVYTCDGVDQDTANAVSSIQVEVAKDGLTVVVPKEGAAERCIQVLGGLTHDQLRWIYSSYSDQDLHAAGWDSTSLKNSDGNPETHLWSELDPRCESVEIRLSGDYLDGDAFAIFADKVLDHMDRGETVGQDRASGYFAQDSLELLVYLLKYKGGISFVSYHHYHENEELFMAVPLQNSEGDFVMPSEQSIVDESYPITRSLYMNLLNNEASLSHTIPLLKFGYGHPNLLSDTGYIPIQGDALAAMLERLEGAPYDIQELDQGTDDDDLEVNSGGFIFAMVIGFVLLLALVGGLLWCTREKWKRY
mmetsp:Transcript_19896/g.37722  ORF Transcript_19896/g.37722 Transcript_19896/m.37722 type:complete len:741 (-) Transcript_19896:63-2285(-)|eukprot:scaffold336_cov196-Amphora_coffeaeformis.AAC.25